MRLIDADALNDTMFRKSFETDDGRQQWDGGLWIRYKVFEEARDEAPTIDAVPVVRCKDCKWSIKDDWICGHPNNNAWNISTEHYCGYGERKDDDKQ